MAPGLESAHWGSALARAGMGIGESLVQPGPQGTCLAPEDESGKPGDLQPPRPLIPVLAIVGCASRISFHAPLCMPILRPTCTE